MTGIKNLDSWGATPTKRISKTQLMATPTVYGEDAKRILKSLEMKPTEQSKINGQKLIEYFEKFEKGMGHMNKYEKSFTDLAQVEMKELNELVLGNDFDTLTRNYLIRELEDELVNVNKTIDVYYKAQPNELFDIQVSLMQTIKYLQDDNKVRNLVQRTVNESN